MEKRRIFTGEENINRLLDVQTRPVEQQRFLYHSGKIPQNFTADSLLETDDKVHYSLSAYTVRFVKNIFYTRKTIGGFSIDKKTNKLNLWFDMRIGRLPFKALQLIVEYYRLDWLAAGKRNSPFEANMTSHRVNDSVDVIYRLDFMFNKTVLNKITKGKVTNLRSLIKAYLDSNPLLKNENLSPELIYKCLHKDHPDVLYRLIHNSIYFVDPNHYIEEGAGTIPHLNDMIEQAKILGRKINSRWSKKKAKKIHQEWTNEIMALELDLVEDINFNYKNLKDLPLIPGLRIINTNKELFAEGMSQHHCVYSNYKNRVKNHDYFVFAYEGKERSTIGITIRGPVPFDKTKTDFVAVINQMYKAYNEAVCHEDRHTIEKWLESEKVQKFFLDNFTNQNFSKGRWGENINLEDGIVFNDAQNLNVFL